MIGADILLIARIFLTPSRLGKMLSNSQDTRYPRILYVKPWSKVYQYDYNNIFISMEDLPENHVFT